MQDTAREPETPAERLQSDTHAPIRLAGSLLIYAPVPVYRFGGALFVERQAINGLRLWAEHFTRVISMMPVLDAPPPTGWLPVSEHSAALERVQVVCLPTAYRPDQFLRAFRSTRQRIAHYMERSEYLSFAIGGLFGDWGAVAALEAHRQNRAFAVWTDRVESEVVRQDMKDPSWRNRLRARLTQRPMAWLERNVIQKAALGLFHGKDTFDAYSPYNQNPHLVHDIHIRAEDHISNERLAQKIASVGHEQLQIVYAGRAEAMKGPLDWIAVLERLMARGVDFRATWLGNGDALEEMRARVAQSGLSERVFLPGFVAEHDQVLEVLRSAHVFMFCHKTPESPRCLIEALCNGTPIVGYEGAYAHDLISGHSGGALVAMDSVEDLSQTVADLAADRSKMARLIANARADGLPFTDDKVFEHRSALIKAHLSAESGPSNAETAKWDETLAG